MDKNKRLLPGDFARKIKYDSLDDTPKDMIKQKRPSFFQFPEDLKGFQFQDREFLVFYFDDEESYNLVKDFFEVPTRAAVSHPELNTIKLVELVRNAKGGCNK